MFWFFGHEACGILAPGPGIELAPPALEGEVLTTGPPGKSLGPVLDRVLVLAPKTWKEKMCLLGQGTEWSQHSGSQSGCTSELPRET